MKDKASGISERKAACDLSCTLHPCDSVPLPGTDHVVDMPGKCAQLCQGLTDMFLSSLLPETAQTRSVGGTRQRSGGSDFGGGL